MALEKDTARITTDTQKAYFLMMPHPRSLSFKE